MENSRPLTPQLVAANGRPALTLILPEGSSCQKEVFPSHCHLMLAPRVSSDRTVSQNFKKKNKKEFTVQSMATTQALQTKDEREQRDIIYQSICVFSFK